MNEPQELQKRIKEHLEKHPRSENKPALLKMHTFFASHSSIDDLYARCARTVTKERIAEDEQSGDNAPVNSR